MSKRNRQKKRERSKVVRALGAMVRVAEKLAIANHNLEFENNQLKAKLNGKEKEQPRDS